LATGFDETLNNALSIYPNPSNDYLFVTLIDENPTDIIISDSYGRKIRKEDVSNGSNKIKVSISELPEGLYFITVNSVYNSYTLKFIRKL